MIPYLGPAKTKAKSEICINWHVTESCNYHCKFCFSKWNKRKEVWTDLLEIKKVLSNISEHFKSVHSIRLNIVGGEPCMYPDRLWNIIQEATWRGMKSSIITNGYYLENIRPFAHSVSQVGISIDSFEHETNIKEGRECNGKTISFENLRQKIAELRQINPNIKIKINSVVNEWNYNEILADKLAELNIDKWKILCQKPFGENKGIAPYQFYTFLKNNWYASKKPKSIFIENKEAMFDSYLMISPDGCFFQTDNSGYKYSRPLTEVMVEDALKEIEFDYSKYLDRYRLVKKYEEWQILEFGDFTHDDSNKIPVLTKRAICEMENFFKLPSSFSDEMEFLEKESL